MTCTVDVDYGDAQLRMRRLGVAHVTLRSDGALPRQ